MFFIISVMISANYHPIFQKGHCKIWQTSGLDLSQKSTSFQVSNTLMTRFLKQVMNQPQEEVIDHVQEEERGRTGDSLYQGQSMGAYSSLELEYLCWFRFTIVVQIITRNSYDTSKNFVKIERLLFRNHQNWKYLGQMKPLMSFSPTPLAPAESKDNLEQVALSPAQLNFEYF